MERPIEEPNHATSHHLPNAPCQKYRHQVSSEGPSHVLDKLSRIMFLMAPDARSPTEGHDPTPRNGPPCTVRRQRSMPAMNYREKTTPGHRHSLMTFPPGAGNSPPKDKQMYPPSCLGLPTWELKPTVQCSPRLNIQQAEHQAVATRATLCVTKDILSHQCSPQGLALLLPGYLHRRRELPCARSSRQRTKGPDQSSSLKFQQLAGLQTA